MFNLETRCPFSTVACIFNFLGICFRVKICLGKKHSVPLHYPNRSDPPLPEDHRTLHMAQPMDGTFIIGMNRIFMCCACRRSCQHFIISPSFRRFAGFPIATSSTTWCRGATEGQYQIYWLVHRNPYNGLL